jgi:CBS domain-containing protein
MFDQLVSRYMTTDLASVAPDAPLSEVARVLADRRISAVPVIDVEGLVLGVVSRADLLHAGRFEAAEHGGRFALRLPDRPAHELIVRRPRLCTPWTTLREAAREMREHRIHRLFVVDDGGPVGVISTLDIVRAVRDARTETAIATLMTAPVVTAHVSTRLADAVAMLDRARVTGLVVVDDRWPVGAFSQAEALAARDVPGDTPIEDLYDASIICMPAYTAAHRAAAQLAQLDVRRLIASVHHEAAGIVTGQDFAALVAA